VFILFGIRAMVKTLTMVTFLCTTYNQPAAHRLSQVTRWFTLFFIPVFPIGRRHVLTCSACGQSSKLTKQQADEIVAKIEAPAQESLPSEAS
jgi:zinc-ribbon family